MRLSRLSRSPNGILSEREYRKCTVFTTVNKKLDRYATGSRSTHGDKTGANSGSASVLYAGYDSNISLKVTGLILTYVKCRYGPRLYTR